MDRLDIDKKRALELGVRFVDSHWKSVSENEVDLSVLSAGYSSRLYVVEDRSSTCTLNPIGKFLIRFYGGKLVSENDPIKADCCEVEETLVFYAMGLSGLGPKLYGAFDGGRVEEFIPSHMLRDVDYNERPETMLELARKLARFHALDLPISKKGFHMLDICEKYLKTRDLKQFRKLADHIGMTDISAFEEFDVSSEIQWLRTVESAVNGRIVTISGDINKNNILIRDEPDKFGERVMIIDYEICSRDFRGRDIGMVFAAKQIEMNDGYWFISSDYPDDAWRRSFVTEYLKQTKLLSYFEWDDKLDSVDHVLMEGDFFMFYCIQMVTGIFFNQGDDSFYYKMPADKAQSMLNLGLRLIEVYRQRKAIFLETYGKQLDLSV
ncbi:hypothetical protein HA402_010649 [Bradysia odoriphaga]|nr:hypothetical protein HA402_010649 [Bradysia odoriphaga]